MCDLNVSKTYLKNIISFNVSKITSLENNNKISDEKVEKLQKRMLDLKLEQKKEIEDLKVKEKKRNCRISS